MLQAIPRRRAKVCQSFHKSDQTLGMWAVQPNFIRYLTSRLLSNVRIVPVEGWTLSIQRHHADCHVPIFHKNSQRYHWSPHENHNKFNLWMNGVANRFIQPGPSNQCGHFSSQFVFRQAVSNSHTNALGPERCISFIFHKNIIYFVILHVYLSFS